MTQFITSEKQLDILREEMDESLRMAFIKPLNELMFIVICSNNNEIVSDSIFIFALVSQAKKCKEYLISSCCDKKYDSVEISLITDFGDLIPLMENDIDGLMKREKELESSFK